MNKTNRLHLQAFLVALVQLPDTETAPSVDKSFLSHPAKAVKSLETTQPNYSVFWQHFNDAYDNLMNGYSLQVKNKVIRAQGKLSEVTATIPHENVSVAAEDVVKLMEGVDSLFDGDVRNNAKNAFQNFSDQMTSNNDTPDYYAWAELLCKPC